VHFLKIDVEGFEEQVIRGNDWTINRPWIVVVESTYPRTQIASYESWEPVLVEADYRHVYSDGLSRFYIAAEHPELSGSFSQPPNVFDEFKPVVQVRLEQQVADLASERDRLLRLVEDLRAQTATEHARATTAGAEGVRFRAEAERWRAEAERSRAELQDLAAEVDRLTLVVSSHSETVKMVQDALDAAHTRIEALQVERDAMLGSLSWKMTYPLRRLNQQARLAAPPLRPIARRALAAAWGRAAASPRFKAKVLQLARKNPRLAATLNRLQQQVHRSEGAQDVPADVFAVDAKDLSMEARELLDVMLNLGKPSRNRR
jgi:uncharacterized protein YukE